MITDAMVRTHFKRLRARRNTEARKPDDAATTEQKLVRAAQTGRLGAIVAAAQPAEPPKMVSPEEREAELRRTGHGRRSRRRHRRPSPRSPSRPRSCRASRPSRRPA